jgi:hypothetical protein
VDVKLFLVSQVLKSKGPSLIVWANDAQAALDLGSRFMDKLGALKPVDEPLASNFQRLEAIGGTSFPAVLEILDTPCVVHYVFEGHAYCLSKNNPVLVKERAVLDQKPFQQKTDSQHPPRLKKNLFRRLFHAA